MRRFRLTLLMLALLVLGGTSYYWFWERMSPADALYMTVIALTTVGFGEPQPLTTKGRLFTVFFISVGVFTFAYAIGGLLDSVLSDELWQSRERKRLRKAIMSIEGHFIICGIGRMGSRSWKNCSGGRCHSLSLMSTKRRKRPCLCKACLMSSVMRLLMKSWSARG